MPTIDNNPSSVNFNCYITLQEAEDIANSRLYSDKFSCANPDNKVIALIQASELLDSLLWKGSKTSQSQLKSFPRTALYDLDGVLVEQQIPNWLKRANFEVAINILTTNPNTEGLVSLKLDTLQVSKQSVSTKNWYTTSVKQLVSQFVKSSFQIPTVRT